MLPSREQFRWAVVWQKKHIILDWRVMDFVTHYQYKKSEEALSLDKKIKMIEGAIAMRRPLSITYLKKQDVKSRRTVTPRMVGEMEYEDTSFLGMEAYCHSRRDTRVFRVDRILEIAFAQEVWTK